MPQQEGSRSSQGGKPRPVGERTPHQQEFIAALRDLYTLFSPLTMASVARRTGVSEASISHWLHGRRTPTEATLKRFHAAASERAATSGGACPIPLNRLLALRASADCTPAVCRGCLAVGSATLTEGDRRNSRSTPPPSQGDRRNGQTAAVVGNSSPTTPPTPPATAANIDKETFQSLCGMAISLPIADLHSAATAMVSRGQEDAARTLLEILAAERGADMVEMTLLSLAHSAHAGDLTPAST
jgi:hypothetical protein